MADLVVDTDLVEETAGNLDVVAREFDDADRYAQTVADAVGDGVRSFAGLRGRAWVMNFVGHGEAARGLQALQNVNAVPQFANRATGDVATLSRLRSGVPGVGVLGSAVVPYTSDVVGNGTLLYRDSKTW